LRIFYSPGQSKAKEANGFENGNFSIPLFADGGETGPGESN